MVNQNFQGPIEDYQQVGTEIISLSYQDDNRSVTPNSTASVLYGVTYDLCLNCSVKKQTPLRLTWRDILDPKFYDLVPEHWLQFEPPSHAEHVALGILYIIILIPALVGNIMIIWLYCTSKPLRTPSNILVVNLAISDLFMNIKMPVFIYNSFCYGPVTGAWGCQVYGFLGGFSGTCAIMTIAAMSAERYISISRPLNPSGRMTTTRALLIALFIWVYSIFFSSMPLFGINRYIPEGFLTSCSFDYLATDLVSRVFVLAFFGAAFCVPLIIICYSYIGIVMAVRKSERDFKGNSQTHRPSKSGKGNSGAGKKTELRLAQIAFTLISIWLISWTPYATVALMGIFTDRKALTPMTSMIPALFAKTSSVFNPFVYSLTHPRYKMELRRRFFWWRGAHNSMRHRMSMPSSISGSFNKGENEHEMAEAKGSSKSSESRKSSKSSKSLNNGELANRSEAKKRTDNEDLDIFESSDSEDWNEDDGGSTEEEVPVLPAIPEENENKTVSVEKRVKDSRNVFTIFQSPVGKGQCKSNQGKVKLHFRRSL